MPCLRDTRSGTPDGAALSATVRARPLLLRADDRRTAVQETVSAGQRLQRRRRRTQSWQLGFDLLQRELRGVDGYIPLPVVGTAALERGFADYCRAAAAIKQIDLPAGLDFDRYERVGEERFRAVTALDIVRHQFRRLLELWLVLDRAEFLVENGFRVAVGEFCPRRLTPRNLLIQAVRSAAV